jgi:3',5'-cyclic AMP phosphodiesterase CpdA
MRTRRFVLIVTLLLLGIPIGRGVTAMPSRAPVPVAPQGGGAQVPVVLPNQAGSLEFAVLGDFGDETTGQFATATQIAKTHTTFPFELVVTSGDNILGSERPQDFVNKFETPYKPLLDAGVTFQATLGNHDAQEQRYYKLFNMNGKLYYSFKAPKQDVRFFMLNSNYMDPDQVKWIENELKTSTEAWKIVVLHHPPYSSSGTHGSSMSLRATLEPMFVKYGVSVVLTGHDHVYERIKPQQGITYFVVGSGGELRRGDIKKTALTDVGFDTDNAFLVAEILDQAMYYNSISRTGTVVDSVIITGRAAPKEPPISTFA